MYLGITVLALTALMFFLISGSVNKGNLQLIHKYHIKNLKQKDRAKYASLYSKGLSSIGYGCLLSAAFLYYQMKTPAVVSMFGGIILGLAFIHNAQKKYNGGWF